jgi:hypothetical protein
MDHRDLPKPARDCLLALSAQVEDLTERATRAKAAINSARTRLTGKFNSDEEYEDVYGTLKKLVADLPIIERKRDATEGVVEKCQAWVDELPEGSTLEPVGVDTDDLTLALVSEQLAKYEEELKELRAVPTMHGSIPTAAEAYVKKLARPKVGGISAGETLQVVWPDDTAAMFALLFPERMVEVIVAEAKRLANSPMPVAERKQRIALLEREIDKRQRQAWALGADARALPPEVVLGVRVVKREAAKKIERRVAVTGV